MELATLWEQDADVWETRWAPVFREFADEVVRRADLKPREWVLDVGTGTGTVLLQAALKVGPDGKAVGIDRSSAMVERARRAAAAAALPSRPVQMDVRALDFPDAWFHAVLSNDGIPYLGISEALAEVRRVLKPGGRFVFSDWATDKVAPVRIFEDVFEKFKTRNPSARLRRLREAVAASVGSAAPFAELEGYEPALREAGFSRVRGETFSHTVAAFSLEGFLEARMARTLARLEFEEMTAASQEEFNRSVREALTHLNRDGRFEVLWPIYYLTAVK